MSDVFDRWHFEPAPNQTYTCELWYDSDVENPLKNSDPPFHIYVLNGDRHMNEALCAEGAIPLSWAQIWRIPQELRNLTVEGSYYQDATAEDWYKAIEKAAPKALFRIYRFGERGRSWGDSALTELDRDSKEHRALVLFLAHAKEIQKEWQVKTATDAHESVLSCFDAYVSEWNAWANGECFGYTLIRDADEEIVGVVGGFIGEDPGFLFDEVKEEARIDYENQLEKRSNFMAAEAGSPLIAI